MFLLYPIFVIKTSLNICFYIPTFCYRRTDILLFIKLENPWRSKFHRVAKYILNINKIYIKRDSLRSFFPLSIFLFDNLLDRFIKQTMFATLTHQESFAPHHLCTWNVYLSSTDISTPIKLANP